MHGTAEKWCGLPSARTVCRRIFTETTRHILSIVVPRSAEFSDTCLTHMRARDHVCAWGCVWNTCACLCARTLHGMSEQPPDHYENMRIYHCSVLRCVHSASVAATAPHAMPCTTLKDSCSDTLRDSYVKHIKHICAVIYISLERLCHTCHAPCPLCALRVQVS